MTRRELRRIARGNDATAWQAVEWLDRYPSRREEMAAGADDAYAAAVARGRRYAWGQLSRTMSAPYLVGYVFELVSRAVTRRLSGGRGLMLAAAVVGALVGAWLSPGRAYAVTPDPAPVVVVAAAAGTWPACVAEDGSGQARCVWDARHMGNGAGRSYLVRHGGTDAARFTYVTHKRAHRLAYGDAS